MNGGTEEITAKFRIVGVADVIRNEYLGSTYHKCRHFSQFTVSV